MQQATCSHGLPIFKKPVIKIPVIRLLGKIINNFCNKPCLSGQQTAFDMRKLGVEPTTSDCYSFIAWSMSYTRLVAAKSLKQQQVMCSWIFFWPFQIRGINGCTSLHLFALFADLFKCLSQGPDLFSEIHCFGGIHSKWLSAREPIISYSRLTTDLLSGRGWVSETHVWRSFHYWQPAARWWPLPMAGKSRQPNHEPLLAWERHRYLSFIQSVEKKGSGGQTLNI